MNFQDAIKSGFENYFNFGGRATRSEFWWWFLFQIICYVAASVLDGVLGLGTLSLVASLALLAPSLAVGSRRLHDINKSGWLQLLYFIPLIGLLVMIYFLVQKSDASENRFGSPRT